MAAADPVYGVVESVGKILRWWGESNSGRSFLGHRENVFDSLVFYHHYKEKDAVRAAAKLSTRGKMANRKLWAIGCRGPSYTCDRNVHNQTPISQHITPTKHYRNQQWVLMTSFIITDYTIIGC